MLLRCGILAHQNSLDSDMFEEVAKLHERRLRLGPIVVVIAVRTASEAELRQADLECSEILAKGMLKGDSVPVLSSA